MRVVSLPFQRANPCPAPHALSTGRTYRYWHGEAPLFPFGHGLSYVQWRLSDAAIGAAGNGSGSAGAAGGGTDLLTAAAGSDGADLEGEAVALEAAITVTNEGSASGSSGNSSGSGSITAGMSVLLFMRLVGDADAGSGGSSANATAGERPLATISGSGCSWAANGTDVVAQLVGYARTGPLAPGTSQRLTFRLLLAPSDGGYGGGNSSSSWVAAQSSWAGFGNPEPPCGLYGLRFGADQPDAALVLLD